MIIAVTGASGHIGVNLIPELIDSGYEIRLLSHKNTAVLQNFNASIIPGDILDINSLRQFIDGADIVIHLAAFVTIQKKSSQALKVNIQGTRNILEISKELGVKKFIHLSSIHSVNVFPLEETLDETRELNMDSRFDYDRSKAVSEQMVVNASSETMSTVVLNPVAVLGPKDYRPSLLGEAILRFYKGRIPAIMDGGYHWVDVRDVVYAIKSAIGKALSGDKFMIAGHWRSLHQLGIAIEDEGGAPCPRWKVPFWFARVGAILINFISSGKKGKTLFTAASLETLQYSHRDISCEKARKILDYQPRPFEKTISDTIDWFRNNNMID